MRFSTAFAVAGFAGASLAKDITVGVGNANGNLIFNPNNIEAAEGDTVWFKFWPKNHSVAQATFANPCQPMENGFWSGFVPTTDNTKAAEQTYMIEITNASAPIWFYCTQGQHCQNGMVGVINPPKQGNRTLEAFTKAAAEADENVSPTSTAGTGGHIMNGTSMTTPSATPTGAASSLQISSFAFSGVFGVFAYMLL